MAVHYISALRSRIGYLCMRMTDALTQLCPRLFPAPRHESSFERLVEDIENSQFSGESRGDDPPPPLHQDYDTQTFSPRPLPRYSQLIAYKRAINQFSRIFRNRGCPNLTLFDGASGPEPTYNQENMDSLFPLRAKNYHKAGHLAPRGPPVASVAPRVLEDEPEGILIDIEDQRSGSPEDFPGPILLQIEDSPNLSSGPSSAVTYEGAMDAALFQVSRLPLDPSPDLN